METIELSLKDHSMIRVNCSSACAAELSEKFSFFVPGYKFMQPYKRKVWDGKIRLFNRMNGEINAGLFEKIKVFAGQHGYGIRLKRSEYGLPNEKNEVSHLNMLKWIATVGAPFLPRDYQYDAITHAIEHKRCLLLSPTGSGKSFIIYLVLRWYMAASSEKILIVVPTTGLVEQMYKDFKDYGFDSENNCHKIYSGKDKETDKQIIISTWQSINKLPNVWF